MQSVSAIMLLLIIVSVIKADQNLINLKKHLTMVKAFTCGSPQPRIIESKEIISGVHPNIKISPPFTVLHRCYSAGFCSDYRTRCLPASTEEVMLTFAIAERVIDYVNVKLINHTSCICGSNDVLENED